MSRLRVALGVGITAFTVLAAGCANHQQPTSPTTETPTTTTLSPTQKALQPTGGNQFTPDIKAPTAATVAPGLHPGINGVP